MATNRNHIWQVLILMMLTFVLAQGSAFASSTHEGHHTSSVDRPLWLDKLENQINYEEMI